MPKPKEITPPTSKADQIIKNAQDQLSTLRSLPMNEYMNEDQLIQLGAIYQQCLNLITHQLTNKS